jgi:signal recognition particle receptor subunit beta
MVSINYSAREVCCKIVYYGPGLSGKTTNLQYIHAKVPQTTRGKLISLATEADRTLYFDFLPINIGTINGFQAKFQLYTVPGQVYYNATRKLVLRGVDGLVFVADSQTDKLDENLESLANLEDNLREYGYNLDELPLVLQYNKRDLPGIMSMEELNAKLNRRGLPVFEASATLGNGVFDTLKLIIKLVLDKAKSSSATAMAKRPPAAVKANTPPLEEAPYPEPNRAASAPVHRPEPVGVAAPGPSSETMGDSQPQAAPSPQPQASPAPPMGEPESTKQPAFRPYPGSEPDGARPKKLPSAPAGGLTQAELPAESLEQKVKSESESSDAPSTAGAPQMAPSLRRRGEGKKRGFFKRLFGIK